MSRSGVLRGMDHVAQWLTVLLPILILTGPAPGDIAASLIALLFLVRTALTRDAGWLHARWVQLLLVLWAFYTLRHVFLPDMGEIGRAAVWIRYPIFAAALSYWVLPDAATQRRLLMSMGAAAIFLGVDTFYQYVTGFDITGRAPVFHDSALRMTGPFSNPRVGITLLWIVFPVALVLLAAPSRKIRAYGIGLAILASVAIFISGERMALLLLLMGWGASFLLLRRARLPIVLLSMMGMLAGGMLMLQAPALRDRQVGETSHGIVHFGDTVYGRMWKAAVQISGDYPLLGVGGKQFQPVCSTARYGATHPDVLVQRCPMHPHNMYLEWAVEGGLISLALFLAVIVSWLAIAWRARHFWWQNPLVTGLLITVMLRLFPISVTTSQFVSWSAVPFWLVAGWLLALLLNAEKSHLRA